MTIEPQIDPESMVARIIAELEGNPEARRLLLRALLTDEFLRIPARLDRIENDIGHLKGNALESRLHKILGGIISQPLLLRRPRIMKSPLLEWLPELSEQIENALDESRITYDQYIRILRTDCVIRAQRRSDQSTVWVAGEASNRVGESDIQRARFSADILATVFQTKTIPVVAGYSIDPRDLARAGAEDVKYIEIEEEY
jgi:hypothetical protein